MGEKQGRAEQRPEAGDESLLRKISDLLNLTEGIEVHCFVLTLVGVVSKLQALLAFILAGLQLALQLVIHVHARSQRV